MIDKLKNQIRWMVFLIMAATAIGIFLTVNVTNYQASAYQEYYYLKQLGEKNRKEHTDDPSKDPAADTPKSDGTAEDDGSSEGAPENSGSSEDAVTANAASTETSERTNTAVVSENSIADNTAVAGGAESTDISVNVSSENTEASAETAASANESENESQENSAQKAEDEPPAEAAADIDRTYYPSYIVTFGEGGTVNRVVLRGHTSYSEDEIQALAETLISSGKKQGTHKNLRYLVKELTGKTEIALLESQAKNRFFSSLMRSAFYCLILSVLFFIFARKLADMIARPVEDSFTKQKQFISDASHELKTPITVINANIELLRTEVGENKWMDHISQEGQRMNDLITNLLTLSRMETSEKAAGNSASAFFVPFDLSGALLGVSLAFESMAFEQGISYDVQIPEDLPYTGNEAELRQLTAILLDNAMKYTAANGSVRITLAKTAQKKHPYCLTVANTGAEIPVEEQEKIFDRFYRTDKSRDRESGGFGLGLPIAKSIAERHRGEIHVISANGWNSFVVLLGNCS